MRVRFLLVGEGSSDRALVAPLEKLCLQLGASEAKGVAPDMGRRHLKPGHRVVDKLHSALSLEPNADLVFIHRDADDADPSPRHQEIEQAVAELASMPPWVGVVPVQMSEAWAMLDEQAIRRAADNPSGRVPLDIPKPKHVERIADPKSYLDDLLIKASGESGRRLDRFKRKLSARRFLLLDQLDLDGPIRYVPAWNRLCDDLRPVLVRMQQAQ
jgi:hypothetical protein